MHPDDVVGVIYCAQCQARLKIRRKYLPITGRKFRCPQCRQVFTCQTPPFALDEKGQGPEDPLVSTGGQAQHVDEASAQLPAAPLILPIQVDDQFWGTLQCPKCGKTQDVNLSLFRKRQTAVKVRCSCGERFHCRPVFQSAVRCTVCRDTGVIVRDYEVKRIVTDTGYSQERLPIPAPCPACQGRKKRPATPYARLTDSARIMLRALTDRFKIFSDE